MNTLKAKLTGACLLLSSLVFSGNLFASDWIYSTKEGDTLWDLCLKYTNKRGCWLKLGQYNNIDNASSMLVGTTLRIPTSWLITAPIVGVVIDATGEPTYEHHITGQRTALTQGSAVHLGSSITTVKGFVRIELGDHSELLIRPESKLLLDSLTTGSSSSEQAEVTLEKGEIDTQVIPNRNTHFQIKTPAAIAAVRGTRYRVATIDKKSMRTEVVSGEVGVDTGRSNTGVPGGFGIRATQGESLGATTKLLPAPQLSTPIWEAPLPITIKWQSPIEAVSWRVDLLTSTNEATLLSSHSTNEPQITFSALAEGCYHARIQAIDKDNFTGMEATQTLCVIPEPPPAPPPPPIPEEQNLWPLALAALTWLLLLAL